MTPDAFSEAFADTYSSLWLLAAGLVVDRALADDILQDAAIIGFRKRDDFQNGTNFRAWMAQIVRHTARNHMRKASRRKSIATDPEELDREYSLAPESPVFESAMDAIWEDALHLEEHFEDEVVLALNSLGAEARVCLLLRVVAELPYTRIAELLEIPEGTAMSHVYRAKRRIRKHLQNELHRERAER